MRALAEELIPHAPKLGLFVAPDIPTGKLKNAIKDYANSVRIPDVLAMYDGTLFGSGKDGVLFCKDRFVYQNNDLQTPEVVRYEDVVRVNTGKRFLSGKRVLVDVNRGRATVEVVIDFSAKPEAAHHVAHFLSEAMLHGVEIGSASRRKRSEPESDPAKPPHPSVPQWPETDEQAVQDALDALVDAGKLTSADKYKMLVALR